jgi:hypothetical protein
MPVARAAQELLLCLYSVSSAMIHGLARDTDHVANHIAAHRRPGPAAIASSSASRPQAAAGR